MIKRNEIKHKSDTNCTFGLHSTTDVCHFVQPAGGGRRSTSGRGRECC